MTIGDEIEAAPAGTNRRTALKKAAIAAGVVAWTTPAVQAVTGRTAHAGTVSNCHVTISANTSLTGGDCQCVDPACDCCNQTSFTFGGYVVECGPLCEVDPIIDLTINNSVRCTCNGTPIYQNCGNFRVSGTVRCGDETRNFSNDVIRSTCSPCTAPLPAAAEDEPLLTPAEDVGSEQVEPDLGPEAPETPETSEVPETPEVRETPEVQQPEVTEAQVPAEDAPTSTPPAAASEDQGTETGG